MKTQVLYSWAILTPELHLSFAYIRKKDLIDYIR